MGLDRNLKTPCGFCFVECVGRGSLSGTARRGRPPRRPYLVECDHRADAPFCAHRFFLHEHAVASLRYVSGTKLDERIIRADLDPGYLENRQYGRGKSGGQVRDEYREDWDGASLPSPLSSFFVPTTAAARERAVRGGTLTPNS